MPKKKNRSHQKSVTSDHLSLSVHKELEVLYKKGVDALKRQDWFQARTFFEAALNLDAHHAKTLSNLGGVYYMLRQFHKAEHTLRAAIKENPDNYMAYYNLGMVLKEKGKTQDALSLFQMTLRLNPGHASATQMAAALSGDRERQPHQDFIRMLFDQYARNFDDAMGKDLRCIVPSVLYERIQEKIANKVFFENVLDLGCGTGLSGLPFRAQAKNLVGVDLSKNMLDIARQKGIYDALHHRNITLFLRETAQRFNLIILADVLVYLGNLATVFHALDRVLTEGGMITFSTEKTENEADDYVLQKSGRYAYSRQYIERVCAKNGYRQLDCSDGPLRLEGGIQIIGTYYLFSKTKPPKCLPCNENSVSKYACDVITR